nr:hypothetical protein [Deltaproteobacteria bacterium]
EFIASHATPVGPATQFVSSVPGAPAITLSGAPPQKRNWQKYALLGAMLLVIIIIAVTRQSPSPPSNARSANERPPALQPPQPAGPHSIRADQPPLNDRKAAKDWNRIVEKLHEQEFGEARQKLDEFERKHGQSPETRSLAEQLDALPEVYRREED